MLNRRRRIPLRGLLHVSKKHPTELVPPGCPCILEEPMPVAPPSGPACACAAATDCCFTASRARQRFWNNAQGSQFGVVLDKNKRQRA